MPSIQSRRQAAWRRWELQADKTVACGTQAYALRSQPLPQGSLPCAVPPVHGVMCLEGHMMPRVHPRGAAGAVKRPVVPHAPSGEMRKAIEFQDRRALEPDNTRGDDACLEKVIVKQCFPDFSGGASSRAGTPIAAHKKLVASGRPVRFIWRRTIGQ